VEVSAEKLLDHLIAREVQADDAGRRSLVEVAMHRLADVRPQFVEAVRFGEDVLGDRSGDEAAFRGFLDDEMDFGHGLLRGRHFVGERGAKSLAPRPCARRACNDEGRPQAASSRSVARLT
jgi:hypothetical protein